MSSQQQQGAIVYAKDLERMVDFYEGAIGFNVTERAEGHVVLSLGDMQLVMLRIPAPIAASIQLTDPPALREDTPIKLVFLADIDAVRAAAEGYGGAMMPASTEWSFQGLRVCDGNDPEGNIFQLRQA